MWSDWPNRIDQEREPHVVRRRPGGLPRLVVSFPVLETTWNLLQDQNEIVDPPLFVSCWQQ